MHTKKYIEKLDMEISDSINRESEKMTEKGEQMLHILFENRKHAKRWAEEMHGHMDAAGTMMDEGKSYPGGGIRL